MSDLDMDTAPACLGNPADHASAPVHEDHPDCCCGCGEADAVELGTVSLRIDFLDQSGQARVSINHTILPVGRGFLSPVEALTLRGAIETMYQSLGCRVINVQRSFERSYDISDRRARPRLNLVGTTGRRSVDVDIRL